MTRRRRQGSRPPGPPHAPERGGREGRAGHIRVIYKDQDRVGPSRPGRAVDASVSILPSLRPRRSLPWSQVVAESLSAPPGRTRVSTDGCGVRGSRVLEYHP